MSNIGAGSGEGPQKSFTCSVQKSFSSSVLCRAGEAALSVRFQAGWFSFKHQQASLHAFVGLFTCIRRTSLHVLVGPLYMHQQASLHASVGLFTCISRPHIPVCRCCRWPGWQEKKKSVTEKKKIDCLRKHIACHICISNLLLICMCTSHRQQKTDAV